MRVPGMPAASAFLSSPPETTSAPEPRRARILEHGQIAVRFDGESDERVLRKRSREHAVMPLQRRARVAIERRADGLGQRGEIDVFGEETAALVVEVI